MFSVVHPAVSSLVRKIYKARTTAAPNAPAKPALGTYLCAAPLTFPRIPLPPPPEFDEPEFPLEPEDPELPLDPEDPELPLDEEGTELPAPLVAVG